VKEQPKDWGKDALTDFFDAARANCFASFHHRPGYHKALVEVDSIYKALDMNHHPFVYPALMVMRGHNAYLTACELAMSTRATESYAVSRTIIENGLYGVYFFRHAESVKVWAARHTSDKARKQVRNTFSYSTLIKTYESINPIWAQRSSMIYEDSIDWGAHPNERSIHGSLKTEELPGEISYQLYSLSAHPELTSAALEHTLRSGIALLRIQQDIFKARVTPEIRKRTDTLESGLSWARV
jgi:hypothetical protein